MTRNAIAAILPWLVPTPADHHERRSTYKPLGKRDTLCRQCSKLFRKADVKGGICAWCEYDNQQSHLAINEEALRVMRRERGIE